jgi:fibronectin type 3 domain-containing protein
MSTHAVTKTPFWLGTALLTIMALTGALAAGKAPAAKTAGGASKRAAQASKTGAAKAPAPRLSKEAKARIQHSYAQLPMSFEVNRGQAGKPVRYISRGQGYTLYLTPTTAVLGLQKPSAAKHMGRGAVSVVAMGLVGANTAPNVTGVDPLPGRSNYLIGNDRDQWKTDIANYAKVRYDEVYPGIDLVYYGNQRQLEYDFIVAPGADPKQVRLAFGGAKRLKLDKSGDLVLQLKDGEVRLQKPFTYQDVGGRRREVASRYLLDGKNRVRFALAKYDARKPLVIDPVLRYSTYIGGSDGDFPTGVVVDSGGNAYITGWTVSFNQAQITMGTQMVPDPPFDGPATVEYPVVGGVGDQDTWFTVGSNYNLNTYEDAILTKLAPNGASLVYSTYFGGGGHDRGHGITINAAGEAFITGEAGPPLSPHTHSIPLVRPTQARSAGLRDAFVARFNAAGNGLLYSTYVGGSGDDRAFGIAVDSRDNAVIAGQTTSLDFNTFRPIQAFNNGGFDAFVTSINTSGSNFNYSTYLGGSGFDTARAVAGDPDGNAYLTGETASPDFPVTPGTLQGTFGGGGRDAFVVKMHPSGSQLVYSTFLGGMGFDAGYGIAIDSTRNAYVTGETASGDFAVFPNPGALQPNNGGGIDAFITKLNTGGNSLVFSTYLGGTGSDRGNAIAVSAGNQAYVVGTTGSSDFPIFNHIQAGRLSSLNDIFVAKLDRPGTALEYSTYLGGEDGAGPAGSFGTGVAVDPTGTAFVTGHTGSSFFPRTVGVFQGFLRRPSYNGMQFTPEPPSIRNEYGPYTRVDVIVARIGSPPLGPTDLEVTNVTQTEVGLAWVDNSDNETGFEVERKTAATDFVLAGTVGANVVTFNNMGLIPNTTYTFRVRGVNGDGQSPYSNQVTVTTLPTPPDPPTNLTVTTIDKTRLRLDWTDASNNEDSFEIERRRVTPPATNFASLIVLGPNTVTHTDINLTPNTTYEYRIRAGNTGGTSAFEGPAAGTTLPDAPTIAPANLTATATSSSDIDLNWVYTPTDAIGFKIERSTDGGVNFAPHRITTTPATTFTDSGLDANTTYHYKVRAYNGSGDGPFSNVASATTFPPAPAAPANLIATAVSASQIDLTWADGSNNETSFRVERSTNGGMTFTEIDQVAANTTSYSDTGLNSATTYHYRVRAHNAGGFSAYSNVANATTLEGPPPAPTNLTATAVSSSQIDLSWTDNSTSETGYKIERSTDGGMSFTEIAQVAANTTSFSNTNLTPETTYHYRVRGTNANGDGPYSNVAFATTPPDPPVAPGNLTAQAVSNSRIDLAWTDTSAVENGFKIERSTDGGMTFTEIAQVPANSTAFSNVGLTANTTYHYRVRAFGAGGDGPYSNVANATTLPNPPGAPGGLAVTALSDTELELNWSDGSTNESGFRIERETTPGNFAQIAQVGANVTTFTDGGRSPNTQYTYRVTAFNLGGSSNPSNTATGLTLPAAPTNLSAQALADGTVQLNWSHVGGSDGFRIERAAGALGSFSPLGTAPAGAKSFADIFGSPGTNYRYRVRAFNASGNSEPSNEASATPLLALMSVTVNPISVRGGTAATGTVTLNGTAPPGGAVIQLSSNAPVALVPRSITIPAGQASASFRIRTKRPKRSRSATITGRFAGASRSANLFIAR